MFTPRHIKQGKLLLRHAEKYLRYKSDVLGATQRAEMKSEIDALRQALSEKDRELIKKRAEALDAELHKLAPVSWESHWRENCEVILVAIVVAVGIRSYFLQPFKIPTGSMQPTLNGIIGYPYRYGQEEQIPVEKRDHYENRGDGWYLKGFPLTASKPNLLQRAVEYVWLGRNYVDTISQQDDEVVQVLQKKFAFFFTFSRIICQHQAFLVYCPPDTLRQDFKVAPGNRYKAGDVIARGAVDTGDQVFVDKLSYNFVKPHRGNVFVFRTNGIPGIADDPETGAPFFIKRLAGVPSDTLRIDPPFLYVDGKIAPGYGFERVMSAKFPYRGYALGQNYLGQPDRTFTVPVHGYFAMGDNSYSSYDSRWWGPVPEENLVGRGLFVYWPFSRHWGLIR